MFLLLRTPALKIRDFRLLLLNKFLLTFGLQMIGVIVGWQIYQMTHDPLALGIIGLAEALAFISFALWAGHIADRTEKRRLIIGSESLALVCAIALLILAYINNTQTYLIYAVIALSGLARSFLWSSSTAFSEMIVPQEIYSEAAAWNSTAWEIASIAGPAVGGVLYGLIGVTGAYAIAAGFVGAGLVTAFPLGECKPTRTEQREGLWTSLSTGVRFVFKNQFILSAITLDMFAVLFGGVVAILPIFAEILKVGPTGLGMLRASQSVGAIIMALAQTRRPAFKNTGQTLLMVVSLFGFCIIAFGLSRNFYLSMGILALAGAVDNISVVIRSSILQGATPNPMRGRVSAVNGIFIGSSNELGAFESGLAAKLMGTVPSVIFGGVMTLLTVGACMLAFPKLRKLKNISNAGMLEEGFNRDVEKSL